jgi:outer membrane immunogenic protein
MKRIALALSAVVALTASASAADLGWNNAPATTPFYSATSVTSWDGFYAGVSGGYGWGTTTTTPAIGTTDNASSGWNFGAQAGYSEPLAAGGSFEGKLDMFGTVRARAGGTFGQVMPYVTLGAAFGRGTAQTVGGGTTTSQSTTHFGWTAGVGIEAKATENISVKAEYLYVDLGSQNYNLPATGALNVAQRFSVIRAGVNYHF